MAKNYVYRIDHDTGFAPNPNNGICTLCGCKKTTIERWAEKGSWVIGIGGKRTGKPNKLIYAMEVDENLPYQKFKKRYLEKSEYLGPEKAGSNVLISRKFYYFGDRAITLPPSLRRIIIDRQGCKCVSADDINRLRGHLSKRYRYGKWGDPNQKTKNRMMDDKCVSKRKC